MQHLHKHDVGDVLFGAQLEGDAVLTLPDGVLDRLDLQTRSLVTLDANKPEIPKTIQRNEPPAEAYLVMRSPA